MKKITSLLLVLLCFGTSDLSFAHPESFDAVLPADAVYEKDLSEIKTEQIDALRKENLGKFYQEKILHHIFTTHLPFKEAVKVLEDKGILMQLLNKTEAVSQIEQEKSKEKQSFAELLKDPGFESAHGTYQGWLIQVFSHTTIAGQKLDRTTIVFSISKKKEIR